MKTLLRLQALHLKIEAFKEREREIPKQKSKFDIHRARLAAELKEREQACKDLALEQRECEGDIEEYQAQIDKYNQQLFSVKKNEEYQALLHEIEAVKKKIALKEDRILAIMESSDDAKARLEEDRNRIDAEQRDLDAQAAEIDAELERAIQERKELEDQCKPLCEQVDPKLMALYERIRSNRNSGGSLVVPLNDEVCSGCNMHIPAQMVNEILAGEKIHACIHCGRILYSRENVEEEEDEQ